MMRRKQADYRDHHGYRHTRTCVDGHGRTAEAKGVADSPACHTVSCAGGAVSGDGGGHVLGHQLQEM